MKKLYLLIALIGLSFSSFGQCLSGFTDVFFITDVTHKDTTFETYSVNPVFITSTAAYTWTFSNGSVLYGDSVTVPYTLDSEGTAETVTLSVIDTGTGCTDTLPINFYYPAVFNCSYLSAAYIYDVVEYPLNDPAGVYFNLFTGNYTGPWSYQLVLHWGNLAGDSVVVLDPTFGGAFVYSSFTIGGPLSPLDPDHPGDTTNVPVVPPYYYTGVYNTSTKITYINPGDGTSCIFNSGIMPVHINGATAMPVITGDTVLCPGDSLHLVAHDTTMEFHNMAHMPDTTGFYLVVSAPIPLGGAYPPSYILQGDVYGEPSAYSTADWFQWVSASGSYIGGNYDSVLSIPSVAGTDSGIYYVNLNNYYTSTYVLDSVHITVGAVAAAITGSTHVCVGDTIMLFDTPAGGTWSMYSTALASVDPVTGIVTGIAAGFDTVYYTIPGTCTGATARYAITVDAPAVFFATSPSACVGTTDSMHAFTPGGTWSSTDPSVATISTTGILDITSAGSTLVMYTLPTGCNMATLINTYGTPTVTATLLRPLLCTGADTIIAAGATSYLWTGGIPCPTCAIATILSPGTYTVTGTDSHGCINTATATVAAGVTPTVSATNNGPLCAGTTLDLTGTVTGATSYSWSGPGGFASTLLDPVLTAAPGTYSLIATGSCGTVSDATTVIVTALPTLTATATYPALCITAGDTLSASGAATYIWSPSAGLSCAGCANPIVTAPATYTVAGTDLSGCVGYATITIAPGTVPTVTANNNGPLCPGEILDLTSIITGGALTTTWSGPDGFTSGAADTAIVSVTTGAVGTYTLTVSNSCGTTVATTDFAISTPTISVTSTPATCGSTFTLAASGASTYTWLPVTGLSCTTCSSPTTSTAGTYTVTGTTAGGCIGSNTVTIGGNRISGYISFTGATPDTLDMQVWLIQFNPTDSSLTALDSTVTCLSGSTPYYEFDGKPAGNYMTKAKLLFGNTPGSSGYIPTYGASTAYWDTATTIAHGTGFDAINIDMLYGTVPSGSGFIGGLVSAGADKGTSTTGIPVPDMMIYLRNVATGKIITYTTTDITGAYSFSNLGAGTYMVYPEDYQYRTTESAPVIISATSDTATGVNFTQHTISMTITPAATAGIKPVISGSAISVYPNPSSGTVNIAWQNQQTGIASVVVTDVVGREVYNHRLQLTTASGTSQTDLSNLNDGIYIITIKSGNSNYTGKLTIQH